MTNFILLASFAYLLGSVSFGHIVARIKKIDLSKIGNKSYTSTNVSRALGWRWGLVTAVFDFSKGVIPTFLAINCLKEN